MLPTISDVWVNWVDGEDSRSRIPEFFEWRDEDRVRTFEQMPVVLVDKELYSFIEQECEELPKDLIQMIDGLSRNVNPATNRVRKEYYAAVVTDGVRTLAFFTEGTKKPTLKSRLTPRHEELVLALVKKEDVAEINWEKPEDKPKYDDGSVMQAILEVDPWDVVGLTRKERDMREILIESIFRLSCSDNDSEIMYWYIEMFPEKYGTKELEDMTRDEMLREIHNTVKSGWTNVHLEFGSNLVKYYEENKERWEQLAKEDVKKRMEKVR